MRINDVTTRRSFIRTAGTAISAPLAVAGPAAAQAAAGDAPPDSLAIRLAALEDRTAIRALNVAFARHVNAGALDALAGLFADGVDVSTAAPGGGSEGGPEGPPLREEPAGASLRAIHGFEGDEVVDVAPDRRTARASVPCIAELETPIPSCPLVEMARAQGGGSVQRVEAGRFDHEYVRRDGIWKIRRSTYRAGVHSPRA